MKVENIKAGELLYAGKLQCVETFDLKARNVGKLVGRCRCCGCVVRGDAAIPVPDPYAQDIAADDTPVVQCLECHSASCDEC